MKNDTLAYEVRASRCQFKNDGISLLVNIGADMKSSEESVKLAEKYDFIYASVGVHPCDTENLTDDDILTLEKLAQHEKVVAIGEIGLDYYWNDNKDVQKHYFRAFIDLAYKYNLPICIENPSEKAMHITVQIRLCRPLFIIL